MAGLRIPLPTLRQCLADTCARLGADAVRYSFIVVDSHHLLLAGFTGALSCSFNTGHAGNLLRGGSWVPRQSFERLRICARLIEVQHKRASRISQLLATA